MFGSRFTMFADVLLVGVLTFVASLPVVTAFAAFTAACRVLSSGSPSAFGREFVAALRSHPGVLVFPLLIFIDAWVLAGSGRGALLPATLVAAVSLVAIAAAARWHPATPWAVVVRGTLWQLARHPKDAVWLLAAAVAAAVLALTVPLTITLAPGLLAFAAVATTRRHNPPNTTPPASAPTASAAPGGVVGWGRG